ncbi:MAG: PepSY domain-containing protein [Pseudochelatococcus sp.]|jgi:hypothetical protein|uniref:PepSY domain-containing protein n=1 Tax=Pseudochelatococcus sp. TaxID=2020869 RepID=UPI003D92D73A
MKRCILMALVLWGGTGAGGALADDRCGVPMASWQPREAAGRAAEEMGRAMGWQVRRIRTDGGCYRIHLRDTRGNRIEARMAPDTLALRRLDVEFAPGGSLADLCAAAAPQRPPAASPFPSSGTRAPAPGAPGTQEN